MLRHSLTWLVIALLSIVFVPGMIEPNTYIKMIKNDQDALAGELGRESANVVIASTDKFYNAIFEDTGFHQWVIERYKIGEKKDDLLGVKSANKVAAYSDKYMTAFFISMYDNMFRLAQMLYWASFALPLLIAAAIDGLFYRQVRIATSQYSSPAVYNSLWHGIILVFSLGAISCNLPVNMPAIAYPIFIGVMALLIRALISNLQRSA